VHYQVVTLATCLVMFSLPISSCMKAQTEVQHDHFLCKLSVCLIHREFEASFILCYTRRAYVRVRGDVHKVMPDNGIKFARMYVHIGKGIRDGGDE
jgi:hypothetical protein